MNKIDERMALNHSENNEVYGESNLASGMYDT